MQLFEQLTSNTSLKNTFTKLKNILESLYSNNSGTSRPTENLRAGMKFFNETTKQTEVLLSTSPIEWGLEVDYDDRRVTNNFTENEVTRITNPKGATYSANAGGVAGAIKITLPQYYTNTMIQFEVEVYNYSTGRSFTAKVAGYTYLPSTTWVNTSATVVAESPDLRPTVRFGDDGTNCCVWIGEVDDTWAYPKVVVRNFMAGYSNYAKGAWDAGWAVSVVGAFDNVKSIHNDTGLKGADWYKDLRSAPFGQIYDIGDDSRGAPNRTFDDWPAGNSYPVGFGRLYTSPNPIRETSNVRFGKNACKFVTDGTAATRVGMYGSLVNFSDMPAGSAIRGSVDMYLTRYVPNGKPGIAAIIGVAGVGNQETLVTPVTTPVGEWITLRFSVEAPVDKTIYSFNLDFIASDPGMPGGASNCDVIFDNFQWEIVRPEQNNQIPLKQIADINGQFAVGELPNSIVKRQSNGKILGLDNVQNMEGAQRFTEWYGNGDLNTLIIGGGYRGYAMPNAPDDGYWHIIVHAHHEQYVTQTAYPLATNNEHVYFRVYYAGVWRSWKKIIDDSMVSEAVVGGTVVQRTAQGFIHAENIYCAGMRGSDDQASNLIAGFGVTNPSNDGWIRRAKLTDVKSALNKAPINWVKKWEGASTVVSNSWGEGLFLLDCDGSIIMIDTASGYVPESPNPSVTMWGTSMTSTTRIGHIYYPRFTDGRDGIFTYRVTKISDGSDPGSTNITKIYKAE